MKTERQQTIDRIADLLESWTDDPEAVTDAEAVFQQMPSTLAALEGDADFEDLVRMASHDVFRKECDE